MSEVDTDELLDMATQIISAYVAHNMIAPEALPDLIDSTFKALKKASIYKESAEAEPKPVPAVPIAESLKDEAIICLEDGLPFQSLKRHLRVKYNMTPEAYREKWGLPLDYPMVAPNYAKRRSALAKKTGLGKNR